MKKFEKLFLLLVAFVVFAGLGIANVKAKEKEKVKVYVFEAGGCPYCEKELEYLKSLPSYGEKFEIIEKELYIDHVDWEIGKDYQLGKTVAEAFKEAGFADASYQGTPFVVISDLYAAATYSINLESYIEDAYKKGDKDIVGCYAKGGTDCLNPEKKDVERITTIVLLIIIAGSIALVVYTGKRNSEEEAAKGQKEEKKEIEKKEEKLEKKESEVKAKTSNNKPAKKPNKKKKK